MGEKEGDKILQTVLEQCSGTSILYELKETTYLGTISTILKSEEQNINRRMDSIAIQLNQV